MKKRLIALILILTMLWSSGLDILPGLCLAYAESNQESREDTRMSAFEDEGGIQFAAENGTGTSLSDQPTGNDASETPSESTENTRGPLRPLYPFGGVTSCKL